MGSIDYQQQLLAGKSSSMNRHPSGIRSRDKLPEIGLSTKLNMYKKRVEQNILSNINKIDKATLTDIYHVSEYCADIQKHMQATESTT